MNLTVLGCGDAFGSGGRNNTAFLLKEGSESILIDCGATTLVQLKNHRIDLDEISTIILSHFHGDHYGGLPFFLISCLFESQRSKPLTIIGPKGHEKRIVSLQEALYPETMTKIEEELDLRFVSYESNKLLEIEEKKVTAYPVKHSPPSIPHGIRLEWKDKVFAFSGDTSWTDELVPLSDQADIFICECNFLDQYVPGHINYLELQQNKNRLNCPNIWLTHMGTEVMERDDLVFNKLSDGMQLEF